MGHPDRRIDVFIAKATRWQAEMLALRAIVLETALDEGFKWRQPVYLFNGTNVAIFAVRKDSLGLAFFRGALLEDSAGLLVSPGDHSQASRYLRFTATAEIAARRDVIRHYIAEAIQLVQDGRKVDFKAKTDLTFPDELYTAFAEVEGLEEAFFALTPGRQRSYAIHFGGAKQSATIMARILRSVDKIKAGKGQLER